MTSTEIACGRFCKLGLLHIDSEANKMSQKRTLKEAKGVKERLYSSNKPTHC